MAYTDCTPRGSAFVRPDLLVIIALSGVLGFSLGQSWPQTTPSAFEAAIPTEDWHGNVRRSTWPD